MWFLALAVVLGGVGFIYVKKRRARKATQA